MAYESPLTSNLNNSLSQPEAPKPYEPPQDRFQQQADYYGTLRPNRYGAEGAFAGGALGALRGATAEGLRLADMDQASLDEAKSLVRNSLPGIMESPLDSRDISDQYAGMLEGIAQTKASSMEELGQFTGASGLRGGQAADLAAMVELGALGSVSRGMRDLRVMQAELDARHKMTQLNAVFGGAQVLGQEGSARGYESLANLAEFMGGMWGMERGARSAQDLATASQDSALIGGGLSLAGQLAGAAVPLF